MYELPKQKLFELRERVYRELNSPEKLKAFIKGTLDVVGHKKSLARDSSKPYITIPDFTIDGERFVDQFVFNDAIILCNPEIVEWAVNTHIEDTMTGDVILTVSGWPYRLKDLKKVYPMPKGMGHEWTGPIDISVKNISEILSKLDCFKLIYVLHMVNGVAELEELSGDQPIQVEDGYLEYDGYSNPVPKEVYRVLVNELVKCVLSINKKIEKVYFLVSGNNHDVGIMHVRKNHETDEFIVSILY